MGVQSGVRTWCRTSTAHGAAGASLLECAPCSALTAASLPLEEDARRFDESVCCEPAEPLRLAVESPAGWPPASMPSACCDPLPPAADAIVPQLIKVVTGLAGFGAVATVCLGEGPLPAAGVACSPPFSNDVHLATFFNR